MDNLAPPPPPPPMKTCPFCREQIRDDAIKCRHCQSILFPGLPLAPPADSKPAPEGKVVLDRGFYTFAKFVTGAIAILIAVGSFVFGLDLKLGVKEIREAASEIQTLKTKADGVEKEVEQTRTKANQVAKELRMSVDLLDQIKRNAEESRALLEGQRGLHNRDEQARLEKLHADQPGQFRTDLAESKLWPNGSTLRIGFLGGSDRQRAKFKEALDEWLHYANLHVDYVAASGAKIRAAFLPQQDPWSQVGTDALAVSSDQPTVNLGAEEPGDGPPPRSYLRMAGHAIGLVREPLNPAARGLLHWDTEAVYKAFSEPPLSWHREQVGQIFFWPALPYPGSRPFDPSSIMMVDLPAKFFTDGKGFKQPSTLSASDKQYIAFLYPQPAAKP